MIKDLSVPARNAFENLGPQNPLRQIQEDGRQEIYAHLVLYAVSANDASGDDPMASLEALSKLMANTRKIAVRLREELFVGPTSDALNEVLHPYQHLPSELEQMAESVEQALSVVGKPGHKARSFASMQLVRASELVCAHLGQYFDEHLAELYQFVSANRASLAEDLSGDAIRKKRKYMKESYPELYAENVAEIRRSKV